MSSAALGVSSIPVGTTYIICVILNILYGTGVFSGAKIRDPDEVILFITWIGIDL